MKKISKKLAALSLASLFFGAAVGLTGCVTDEEKTEDGGSISSTLSISNAYIVVSENGVETLHKGNLIERTWRAGASDISGALTPVLKFNCGTELQTTQFVAYTQGCPSEDKYDKICDCAYENTLPPKEETKSHDDISVQKFVAKNDLTR